MKRIACYLCLLLSLLFVSRVQAGQLRVYVAEFNVTGAANRDEIKGMLQDLLASRLNGEQIRIVEEAAEADIVLTGRYSQAGSIFSIDTVARNAAGKAVARAYEEGESQSQLIPTVGRLVPKLTAQLLPAGVTPGVKTQAVAPPSAAGAAGPAAPAASDVIAVQPVVNEAGAGWISQRLTGNFSGLAVGRTLKNGERELFIISEHVLRFYRQGKELQLVAEVPFKVEEQLLGVDTADLDGDGIPEVYLTIFNGDALVSQVWVVGDNRLEKIAGKLPYYFRSIALDGKSPRLYGQQMSLRDDFFGDVLEVVKSGTAFTLQNPLKLPRYATLYNFNRFTDRQGNPCYVVLSNNGDLLVYDQSGEELWQSKEKFGGSELAFKRQDLQDVKYSSEPYRRIYLQQRMVVTSGGEIIVARNSGFWNIGNNRAYSNSAVYGFGWNGSSLEKKWHTRESENYIADYQFDPLRQELVLLEVVKHAGMFDKGASVVAIKKVH